MKSTAKQVFCSLALFAASIATPVAAEDISAPHTVDTLGLAAPGYATVTFKNASNLVVPAVGTCLYDILYIDVTAPAGKLLHQQLLLAKTTGKRMSRIGYTPEIHTSATQCFLWVINQSE